ncbi:hypothetical protein ACE14D_19500, partial [Streptomyces sp. Act-28]
MSGLHSWAARWLLLGLGRTAAVVLLVFLLTEALPGDAAVALAGDHPDPQRIAALREAMEPARSAHERFADWAAGFLRGDPGASPASGRPLAAYTADGFGPTLLPAARHEGRFVDRFVSATTPGVHAVPEFAFGVLLITVFAPRLGRLSPTVVGHGTALLAHPAAPVLSVLVLLSRPVCSPVRLLRRVVRPGWPGPGPRPRPGAAGASGSSTWSATAAGSSTCTGGSRSGETPTD